MPRSGALETQVAWHGQPWGATVRSLAGWADSRPRRLRKRCPKREQECQEADDDERDDDAHYGAGSVRQCPSVSLWTPR